MKADDVVMYYNTGGAVFITLIPGGHSCNRRSTRLEPAFRGAGGRMNVPRHSVERAKALIKKAGEGYRWRTVPAS
jgi:hypothetical protein